MLLSRMRLAWLVGGAAAAAVGFFAAGIFVSKTAPESQTVKTLAPFSLPTSSGDTFSSDQPVGSRRSGQLLGHLV